jgi:small subunit ribosomal protein S1
MIEGYDYEVGGDISVLVLNPHDGEGNVVLSHKNAEVIAGWNDLEEAFDEKKKITVKVADVVKGGVTASYRGVRCFIPGSLLSYRYVKDMSSYIGKELEVLVEDFDRENQRAVLSRKAIEVVEREAKKKELMDQLQVGEIREGVVTKLMKFGAFVDLGGTEGLIYIDDLAWHRVNHPSEVVSEGDYVTVYVTNIDKKNDKIGLSLKDIEEDPWIGVIERYKVDDLVEGKVVRLMDFGAFVEIEPGIEGLVHLSEISTEHVRKPSDVLKVGQSIKVTILSINEKEKRIGLSMKEAEGRGEEAIDLVEDNQGTTIGDLFGDKLKGLFKE